MVDVANEAIENLDFLYPFSLAVLYHLMDKDFSIKVIILQLVISLVINVQ